MPSLETGPDYLFDLLSSKVLVYIESTFLDLEAGLGPSFSIYNPLKLNSRWDIDFYLEGVYCDKQKIVHLTGSQQLV